MCGIAGFSLHPNDDTTEARRLTRSLFAAIEERGRHASGAAWTESGEVWLDKAPLKGSIYGPLLTEALPADSRTAILHTRYATQGDPSDNNNNHPFALPGLTGIHNGIVDNDRDIFDLLNVKPTTEVDSEAIFALLVHGGFDHPADALELVEGDAAVAWLPTDAGDDLNLARLRGRPLALARLKSKSLVFASTESLLRRACNQAGVAVDKLVNVKEGTYIRARFGTVREHRSFDPPRRVYVPKAATPVTKKVSTGTSSKKGTTTTSGNVGS